MGIIRSARWLVLVLILMASVSSFAGVFVSVSFGPPALPVYEQPICPAAGYLWTPGYWAYGPNGYFWVPGTWVLAPEPGFLWTPGYWGWGNGLYLWHAGYWGPTIGFYGGINYGYGYYGSGYQGGYWRNREFFYNRSVNNVNVTRITNVYNTTVINNNSVNRVSYNGGQGGIQARPTQVEERAARERHFAPTALQTRHETSARGNRELWASVNKGRPAIAATARPAEFKRGVVAAREAGAPYTPPANRGVEKSSANSGAPRPGNNVPRPGTAERDATPMRGYSPRPSNPTNREMSPRVENTSRQGTVPRPENSPRGNMSGAENVPRPGAAGREQMSRPDAMPRSAAPRPETAARQPAPRAEVAPRAAAPRPQDHRAPEAAREARPEPKRPQ